MKTISTILMVIIAIGLIAFAWSSYTKMQDDTNQAVAMEQNLAQSSTTESDTSSEWTACETDDECVAIGTECCEANYTRAVNVNFVDIWRAANPKQDCAADTMCIMMIKVATCQNGQCIVAPTNSVTE